MRRREFIPKNSGDEARRPIPDICVLIDLPNGLSLP